MIDVLIFLGFFITAVVEVVRLRNGLAANEEKLQLRSHMAGAIGFLIGAVAAILRFLGVNKLWVIPFVGLSIIFVLLYCSGIILAYRIDKGRERLERF